MLSRAGNAVKVTGGRAYGVCLHELPNAERAQTVANEWAAKTGLLLVGWFVSKGLTGISDVKDEVRLLEDLKTSSSRTRRAKPRRKGR